METKSQVIRVVEFKLCIASGYCNNEYYGLTIPYRVAGYNIRLDGSMLVIDSKQFSPVKDVMIGGVILK